MSGDGLLPDCPIRERLTERDDVLAYLEQRLDNAELMARRWPAHAEVARERARQIGVMIDELRSGLHVGAALVRTALLHGADNPLEGA